MTVDTPAIPGMALMLQHLADAVYLLDPDSSRIVWGNHAAWESLGLSPEQVLDHSVLSLQMDVAGGPQWSEIAAVIRSVPCYTFMGRHRHALGHEVPVEVNTTHFVDGGREYFLSVARDVSRRVALETELKKRENQLWFALNEAMDGLWDWNVATSEVFFSPQLKRMLGYGPDEMAPTLATWSQNIHPDDVEHVMGRMNAHLQGRRARYEAEYRLRARNGHYLRVMDLGKVCERDATGAATRVVGMVQDVTAQREAQAALQRSEEEQRTLIAALPDVIMRLDRNGRHLFVSENIVAMAAMPASAIVGRTHRDLGFPEPLCHFWDVAIETVFRTGQTHESEFELPSPNGPRVIGWRVVPDLDPVTGVRTVLAICRDVTERRQAEIELARHRHHLEDLVAERTAALSEAKAAAEEANRAKSRFLAHMSHELRTPLGAIIGMTALARASTSPVVVDARLAQVEQASHHLLSLINDILDLSKIEAQRLALDDTGFRLAAVFDSVAVLAGHRAHEKGLDLVLSLDPALGARTWVGDPLRLKQILLNLVDNAIKFTAQGRVELRVRLEPADTENDAGAATPAVLRFEVVDTGIGIAHDAADRLFLPFEQADNSTTRRYGGTGLGLTISRQLVHMMGGRIGLDSTPGQGSTVWFTLPTRPGTDAAADPTEPAAVAPVELARQHAGRTVLVADDDPVCRDIASEWLRHAGLTPVVAQDGQEALTMAAGQVFDMILMDMQMPLVNGLDATLRIRSQGLNRGTPIVALTANAFEDDRTRCLAAGMDDYLTKPVQPDDLYRALSGLLGAGSRRRTR